MIKHDITRVKRRRYQVSKGREFGRRANERLKKRLKKPIPRMVVPSFFTLMNLLCGFLAIIQIYEGFLVYGAWLIVLAALFDALDGFMARLTNGQSEFGTELDSISDVVSFGAAPGFLIYAWAFSDHGAVILLLVAALPVLCGAVRLARFNVEAKIEDLNYFRGLPIPAQAMMLVAFFLTFHHRMEIFDVFKHGVMSPLVTIVIILSLLMVSTVPFDKVPRFTKPYIQQHKVRVWLFIFYAIAIIAFQEYGLIVVFTIFIFRGIWNAAIHFWNDVMSDDEVSVDPG